MRKDFVFFEEIYAFLKVRLTDQTKFLSEFGTTCRFMLPHGSCNLGDAFELLGTEGAESGIMEWSVRQSSLEEVFINIALLHGGAAALRM